MMVQVRPYSIPAGGQSGCRSAGPSPRLREGHRSQPRWGT